MPNWSSIEAGFLRLSRQIQLGELAACLASIKAWSLTDRNVVPVILDESILYASLIQRISPVAELSQLQQLLQGWKERWLDICSHPTEIADVIATSASWSERLLDMSGLLVSESKSA